MVSRRSSRLVIGVMLVVILQVVQSLPFANATVNNSERVLGMASRAQLAVCLVIYLKCSHPPPPPETAWALKIVFLPGRAVIPYNP